MLWSYYWQSVRGSVAGTGGPGGVGNIVLDTFTDETENQSLDAHTPDTSPGGALWSELQGVWEVNAGSLRCVTNAGDGQNTAVIDAGVANCTVEVDAIVGAGSQDHHIVFNTTDVDNHWLVQFDGSNWNLYQRSAGAFTLRGTSTVTLSSGNTYRIKVVTNGDNVKGYVDGVEIFDYTHSGARPHKTATKHGVTQSSVPVADENTRHDNFRVYV